MYLSEIIHDRKNIHKVVIPEQRKVIIIDDILSTQHVHEITYHVKKNAQLDVYSIQKIQGIKQNVFIYAAEKSMVRFFSIYFSQNENTIEYIISGDVQSHISFSSLFIIQKDSSFSLKTIQNHREPSGMSSVLCKGILLDDARGDFRGIIDIHEKAVQTNAKMYNKNIVLHDSAHMISIPSLEVKTNDVHCAHGTATGQLDQDQIMFLQSRGISENKAKKIILHGFIHEFSNLNQNFENLSEKINTYLADLF